MGKRVLALLDKIPRLGLARNKMTAKDCGPFSRIVNVTDILFEVGGYLSIPHGGRDGDRD